MDVSSYPMVKPYSHQVKSRLSRLRYSCREGKDILIVEDIIDAEDDISTLLFSLSRLILLGMYPLG